MPIRIVRLILVPFFVLFAFSTSAALAQFSQSDRPLYFGYLELARESDEVTGGPITEYSAYAISVRSGEFPLVLYVLTGVFKGETFPLGAFRCDVEFTLLDTYTNDMRDIKCVQKTNTFGIIRETFLNMGSHGLYVQDFNY